MKVPELKKQEAAFVWNLFSTALNVSDTPDEFHDQFYDHQNHSSARDVFQKMALSQSVAEPGAGGYSPLPPPPPPHWHIDQNAE